jgi:hypothetical protein
MRRPITRAGRAGAAAGTLIALGLAGAGSAGAAGTCGPPRHVGDDLRAIAARRQR